ncbi:unnamed protein product [Toxocara canis]|uniref:Glucuronosyltransferase n=1 Tax=Toxocara canis TaxID=6265 RepID=A0A183TZ38_TOXCA|nr:unnamed protein product [Toxocara canis]
MLSTLILIVIMLSSSCSHGYKVLIFSPKLYRSHVVFMGRIADILADSGHDVVSFAQCRDQIFLFGYPNDII